MSKDLAEIYTAYIKYGFRNKGFFRVVGLLERKMLHASCSEYIINKKIREDLDRMQDKMIMQIQEAEDRRFLDSLKNSFWTK